MKFNTSSLILMAIFIFEVATNSNAGSITVPSSKITLAGTSSGKTLSLIKASSGNPPYLTITNAPGETGSSVAQRLAQAINSCIPCQEFYGRDPAVVSNNTITLAGGLLNGKGSVWALGGNEVGFNIPPCPTDLTASFESGGIKLRWQNPQQSYDTTVVIFMGIPWAAIDGAASEFFHNWKTGIHAGFSDDDVTYQVVGYKKGVPSNVVGVRLRGHSRQEIIFNAPFSCGIASGFEQWVDSLSSSNFVFEEGSRPGLKAGADNRQFHGNGFYQIISSRGGGCGGVVRRFIGLASDHKYRVTVRAVLLDASGEGWGLSFHAAASQTTEPRYSAARLAGKEDIGSRVDGPSAAQLARFTFKTLEKGKWIGRISNEERSDNLIRDVIVPPGFDSITVWCRLENPLPSVVRVGVDSPMLEDLGPIQ